VKRAALRGLIFGLIASFAVLSIRPAFALGAWLASVVHPEHNPSEIYLDVH